MKKYKDNIHLEFKQELESKIYELKNLYGITERELMIILNEVIRDYDQDPKK